MSSALTHKTLVPGAVFPEIQLSKLDGSTIRTSFNTGRHTLIVILRGIFCPICNLQTAEIAEKLDALQVSGIDVLIFSADSKEATAEHSKKSGNVLDSHFAYGLDSAQIKTLVCTNPVQLDTFLSRKTLQSPLGSCWIPTILSVTLLMALHLLQVEFPLTNCCLLSTMSRRETRPMKNSEGSDGEVSHRNRLRKIFLS